MAAAVVGDGVKSEPLEQGFNAPAATKSDSNAELLQLHRDGIPFVLPMRRGIDVSAPGFDPDDFLDLLAEDFMYIQHAKLREILEVMADVEYLQRHGLNRRTDLESFRKCVPVVSYGDLEDDIMRLVNGEKAPIFTVDPISNFNFRSTSFSLPNSPPGSFRPCPPLFPLLLNSAFHCCCSSGTTAGKPKFIPSTHRSFENFMFIMAFVSSIYSRYMFSNLNLETDSDTF